MAIRAGNCGDGSPLTPRWGRASFAEPVGQEAPQSERESNEAGRVRTSAIGRTAAIAAVVIAGVAVAVIVLRGGGSNYTVKADFQNASQLVKGNLVQVSGEPVGKVTGITLTDNGQAEVTMKIDGDYAPLRQGTQATVRASSLSGIANRYVDLNLAPANASHIPSGGVIVVVAQVGAHDDECLGAAPDQIEEGGELTLGHGTDDNGED